MNYICKKRVWVGWSLAVRYSKLPRILKYLKRVESRLNEFWSNERLAASSSNYKEEIECETHYANNLKRAENGRYVVRLPFRESSKHLGESRSGALKRLSAMKRKFQVNETLRRKYTGVIDEYIRSNYISLIENPDGDGYYMPHHAVIKESRVTTRVRIVFDASTKTSSGVSQRHVDGRAQNPGHVILAPTSVPNI